MFYLDFDEKAVETNGVKIQLNGNPTGTKVWIDGVEQSQIRKVTLVHEAGSMPVLTLERFVMSNAIVEGPAEVKVKDVVVPAGKQKLTRCSTFYGWAHCELPEGHVGLHREGSIEWR